MIFEVQVPKLPGAPQSMYITSRHGHHNGLPHVKHPTGTPAGGIDGALLIYTFLAKPGSSNRASTGNVCVSNHCNRGRSIPVPVNAYCWNRVGFAQALNSDVPRRHHRSQHATGREERRTGRAARETEGSKFVTVMVAVHSGCASIDLHDNCPYPAKLQPTGASHSYQTIVHRPFAHAGRNVQEQHIRRSSNPQLQLKNNPN